MTNDILFVCGVLAVAVVLFASGRVRLDITALLVVFALVLGDILTLGEALAGFSDPVVLMIAGLFVVGEALVTTGVAFSVGQWLMRVGGASEARLLALLMVSVGTIGAFMSSTGIVALFLPIVLGISAKTGFAKTRLLMPLSIAALISGMMTLIATPPNLVVNAELRNRGLEPFGFFEFTPIGIAVLVVGVLYVLTIGRRLLSATDAEDPRAGAADPSLMSLAERYGLIGKLSRLRIPAASPLVGQSIGGAKLRTRFGVAAVGIERREGRATTIMPALAHTELATGDVLYVVGGAEPAAHFIETKGLQPLPIEERPSEELTAELGLAEVMLPPDSGLIGRTLHEAAFRSRRHVSVLAIRRGGAPIEESLTNRKLKSGDTLLVSGSWKDIAVLREEKHDFVVLSLPAEMKDFAPARRQAPWALGILAVMVAAMVLGLAANAIIVLIAALAMVVSRCLTMDAAYRVINWPSLVLLAGMLPLATALQNTGATDLIVKAIADNLGGLGPTAMLVALFLLTAVMGLFISNTATAVLLAPIAIGIAADMGVSPYPYVMTVAVAASAAFMTPVSTPVNTLVVAPGGYTFGDFVKVGVPLTILVMLVATVLIPLLFPF